MKAPAFLLIACLAWPSCAPAMAVGHKACAEALVTGDIVGQAFETVPSSGPGEIAVDGIVHIDFDVRRVRYGAARKGRIKIVAIAHTLLNRDVHDLYLHRRGDAWWVADCTNR
jgi:hypothetical protein